MLLGSYSNNYSPKFGIHKGNPRQPARTHGLARTRLVLRGTSCVLHLYFTCFGLFLQNSRCFNKTQDVSEWLEVDQGDFPISMYSAFIFQKKCKPHAHIIAFGKYFTQFWAFKLLIINSNISRLFYL